MGIKTGLFGCFSMIRKDSFCGMSQSKQAPSWKEERHEQRIFRSQGESYDKKDVS